MNRKQRRVAGKLGQTPSHPLDDAAAAKTPGGTAALVSAIRHHQAGRFAEAEACYRQALAAQPAHPEIHFNLGLALRQQGKLDQAIAAYRQTIALEPNHADAHYNLGNALMGQGKRDEAIAAYRQAIASKRAFAQAHYNLGVALNDQDNGNDAIAAFRNAIAIKSDYAEAHYNLGNALNDQGMIDDAVAALRNAISIKLNYAEAHYSLGNALRDQRKPDAAIAAYRQAIAIKPDFAEARSNLGNALSDQGKREEAVSAYRQAIHIQPNNAEFRYNFGNALKDQGKLGEAAVAYRQAIEIKRDHAEAHLNLGIVLMGQGMFNEAHAEYLEAIRIKPDNAEAYSNFLLCLHYIETTTADQLFAAHRQWDERFGRQIPRTRAHANDRAPGRRLKIGYATPDFREHSVAYFVEPLLQAHDRQAVEVFCYAEVMRPDKVTARLREHSDHWLETVGLSDDALAERIRTDGIDILVDLAGHTAYNRLLVFARKPAPVQVTWLGYPNTTGLTSIDYRLVDAVTDPAGAADAFASEILLRLDDGFLCFGGVKDAPEAAVPPCLASGIVTFGSFNNPAKASAATLDVWAMLLARLPQARLLLKGKPLADAATRALFLARLGERRVAAERVELEGWLSGSAAHLAHYGRIDIALDPFPYNGTTTTCEALWMGVPVVTLKGDRHSGRVGASLLGHLGMSDWIAGSVEEYVEIALALAGNPGRLRDLRRALRSRMAASPLCDRDAFARKIEAAFRKMWHRYCEAV